MLTKFFIVLLLCMYTVNGESSQSSANDPVAFGGECNKTARCDSHARLICSQGICQCMKQDDMAFDRASGKCLVKAGERCIYILGERDDSSYYIDPYSCVHGASCSKAESTCTCNDNFYQTSEGTCAANGLLGDSCTENRHCSESEGFRCIQGTCQCDFTSSEYNAELKHCVGLVGRPCIQDHCTHYAYCETNVCFCPEDFWENTTGQCHPKVGHLENCTVDAHCKQVKGMELMCVKGVCNCDPSTSVYATVRRSANTQNWSGSFRGYENQDITRCVPLPGQECKDRLCAPGAYCKHHGLLRPPTCECRPSLNLSKRGTCSARENSPCQTTDECTDGLACVNERCKCKYEDQVYYSTTNSCLSKIGGPCNANMTCIPHSYCHIKNDGGTGHCVCNKGLVPNNEDLCEVAGGGQCNSTRNCDSIASLECVSGLCQCKRVLAQFDPINRKCVGKVGAHCSVLEEHDCIKNSKCEQTHPKLPARCACIKGYSEAPDYTCQLNQEEDTKFTTAIPTAGADKLGE